MFRPKRAGGVAKGCNEDSSFLQKSLLLGGNGWGNIGLDEREAACRRPAEVRKHTNPGAEVAQAGDAGGVVDGGGRWGDVAVHLGGVDAEGAAGAEVASAAVAIELRLLGVEQQGLLVAGVSCSCRGGASTA